MKTFELAKTSIPDQYSMDLKDHYMFTFRKERVPDLYRIMFSSIADYLKNHESKDRPRIGFIMKDADGNFKIGAILIYQKAEADAEEDTGNWYLQMSFNEADMKDLSLTLDNNNAIFFGCSSDIAWNTFSGRFTSASNMNQMFCDAVDNIVKFLDYNASEEEEVELVHSGIFVASVVVEKGEKIMSIVPGDHIKQIIKNDAGLV